MDAHPASYFKRVVAIRGGDRETADARGRTDVMRSHNVEGIVVIGRPLREITGNIVVVEVAAQRGDVRFRIALRQRPRRLKLRSPLSTCRPAS